MVCFLAVSGCVRIEQDIALNRDGTGTITLVYAVKEQDFQRMGEMSRRMAAIDPSLAPGNDVDWLTAFDEEVIRREWAKEGHRGLELDNVVTGLQDGWRSMRATIRFETLQDVLDSGIIRDCHISLTRGPSGQYGYQQAAALSRLAGNLPEGMDLETLRPMLASLFEDFSADIRFTAPGEIIRSNADYVSGRSAIWRMRGSDPSFIEKIEDLDIRLMFTGEDLRIADAVMLK